MDDIKYEKCPPNLHAIIPATLFKVSILPDNREVLIEFLNKEDITYALARIPFKEWDNLIDRVDKIAFHLLQIDSPKDNSLTDREPLC